MEPSFKSAYPYDPIGSPSFHDILRAGSTCHTPERSFIECRGRRKGVRVIGRKPCGQSTGFALALETCRPCSSRDSRFGYPVDAAQTGSAGPTVRHAAAVTAIAVESSADAASANAVRKAH